MESFINKGTIVLNKPDENQECKTVVVLGVARSGTSMVASVLEELGVFMGKHKDEAVKEDHEIIHFLEKQYEPQVFRSFVDQRNENNNIWGWKRPGAISYRGRYENELRNLHYIIVFRDVMAIAMRNNISVKADFIRNLKQTQKEYDEVIELIQSTQFPCLLISYEKAILKKEHLVQTICSFLDLSAKSEQTAKALGQIMADNPAYLKSARIDKISGVLDRVTAGTVRGWAYQSNSEAPIEVNIFVNGNKVVTLNADQFREDLKKSGIGNGFHSFVCDISSYLSASDETEVRVVTTKDNIELNNSPFRIKSKPVKE